MFSIFVNKIPFFLNAIKITSFLFSDDFKFIAYILKKIYNNFIKALKMVNTGVKQGNCVCF
jgi:hypothetical protein